MIDHRKTPKAAFTLIELLVVIGIIALLASLVGLGLRGGNQAASLQAAQGTISSLISITRAQAALKGTNARLLINVEPSNRERFLRYCVVEVQDPIDLAKWTPIDGGTLLPAGIAVVPNRNVTIAGISGGLATLMPNSSGGVALNWATAPVISSTSLIAKDSRAINSEKVEAWLGLELTERGTSGTSGHIIVSSVTVLPATSNGSDAPFAFNNPENVRGVTMSSYGVVSYINDRSGFLQ